MTTHESNHWQQIQPQGYDSELYSNSLILEVYEHQQTLLRPFLQPNDALVEVGCGSGRFCMQLDGMVSTIVGVDISTQFLDFIQKRYPSPQTPTVLVEGDATGLSTLLRNCSSLSQEFWDRRRVVCCVMNTLGIIPLSKQALVVQEMMKLLGQDGLFFLTLFNGDCFAQGIEQLYKMIPGLCGNIEPGDYSIERAELRVLSTGYSSHWFKEEEVHRLLRASGLVEYSLTKKGIGLFVRNF